MKRRITTIAFAVATLAATVIRAEQPAPRDIWPQATTAARDGDYDAATKRASDLVATGKTYGLKTYPLYASSAAGLARESTPANPDLAKWAVKTAGDLDPRSPAVAFSEADRAAASNEWGHALPLVFQGFARMLGNYRTNLLGRADLLILLIMAVALTAITFAIVLFIRYGRSMGHDFREILATKIHGGSVSVLAFALLFLPIFLWLGPMWLAFYWMAIFFAYAEVIERVMIVLLLLAVAALPIALDATSNWIAGVDSPVVQAAIASEDQSYQPEALRRLQELISVVPDNAMLQLLLGNLFTFEGADDQALTHYKRAAELRRDYAGAHVNLGNLHFINNEFQAAITEYETAQRGDPQLAIAFYNDSVASGETYKFDQQAKMLERARQADRSTIEKLSRTPPPQKIVWYHPSIAESWDVTHLVTARSEARTLFGNYATFDPIRSLLNPLAIGAIASILLALALWAKRRRSGLANACIKCGRTFCYRCKSARESSTYCTQCIHIYLKRDGVSLDTKRLKLEEVTEHQSGMQIRNRIFTTFLPGSAQMLEGRTLAGILGMFLFGLFVAAAIFSGRLAPALGPVAHVAQLLVRYVAIAVAVLIWIFWSLPVYRRRVVA